MEFLKEFTVPMHGWTSEMMEGVKDIYSFAIPKGYDDDDVYLNTGDCVPRAQSLIMNRDFHDVVDELQEFTGRDPRHGTDSTMSLALLSRYGFEIYALVDDYGCEPLIEDVVWSSALDDGSFYLSVRKIGDAVPLGKPGTGHSVCVKDGKILDMHMTWIESKVQWIAIPCYRVKDVSERLSVDDIQMLRLSGLENAYFLYHHEPTAGIKAVGNGYSYVVGAVTDRKVIADNKERIAEYQELERMKDMDPLDRMLQREESRKQNEMWVKRLTALDRMNKINSGQYDTSLEQEAEQLSLLS